MLAGFDFDGKSSQPKKSRSSYRLEEEVVANLEEEIVDFSLDFLEVRFEFSLFFFQNCLLVITVCMVFDVCN